MRQFILAVGLIFCGLTNHDALAQDFWYVLPGYDNGYTYGFDLGGGVGFGYGAAIGIPLPLSALNESRTAEEPQVQSPSWDEAASTPTSTVNPAVVSFVSVKPKPAAVLKAKMSKTKVPPPKPIAATKKSKPSKHMNETTGQPT
jgi:hypothetical protein